MQFKLISQLTFIILANLFAFLVVWHILDSLFWKRGFYTLLSILISLVPLCIFLVIFLKKTLKELGKNSTHNLSLDDTDRSHN